MIFCEVLSKGEKATGRNSGQLVVLVESLSTPVSFEAPTRQSKKIFGVNQNTEHSLEYPLWFFGYPCALKISYMFEEWSSARS